MSKETEDHKFLQDARKYAPDLPPGRDVFYETAAINSAMLNPHERLALIESVDGAMANDEGDLRRRAQLLTLKRKLAEADDRLRESWPLMAALRDALNYQSGQAMLAELIQNEAAMVERFALPAAPPASDADLPFITEFSAWCSQRRVRCLPSRPEVVGTFLKELAHRGPEYVLAMVEAIGRMHTQHPSLSNPAFSRAVEYVLNEIVKIEPPRSWPRAEKILFAALPAQIKAAIARRETERESGLRKKQTAMDLEIKKLQQRQSDGAETKPVNTKELQHEEEASRA